MKEVLSQVDEDSLFELTSQTLFRLVTTNEEKYQVQQQIQNGEAQEVEDISPEEQLNLCTFIVKYFNGIMLRILDNGNINMVFNSLFKILLNSQSMEESLVEKVFSLDLHCINRLTKTLKNRLSEINPSSMLLNIKRYLEEFGMDNSSDLKKRGTGIVRVLMKELVVNFSEQQIW